VYSNRDYWYGFNGTSSTWYTSDGSQTGQYLAYEFATAKKIVAFDAWVTCSSVSSAATTFKIQKSADNITWEDVTDNYTNPVGTNQHIVGGLTNTSTCKYWRLLITGGPSATPQGAGMMVEDLRLYGREDV
jgi:hypothetical protein